MTQYILRRLIYSVFIMWGCATIIFFMLRMVPGDPVAAILGIEYTPEAAAQLRKNLGLDRPIYVQYVDWMGGVLHGDLGKSIDTRQEVSTQIKDAFPKTLSITVLGFLIGVIVAVPLGILAALTRDSVFDWVASSITFIGISLPTFWFGIVFILLFAVQIQWFPSVGYVSPTEGIWPWFKHLVLPGLAAGVGEVAILMRFVRAGLLETMGSDYVRTARAKGLPETRVILSHAMRNSMIPVVTVAGLSLAALLGGLVITETVFAISGIGRLLTVAIFAKDYPVVQGVILLITFFFVLANLLVDILYTFLDPRIRYG